jgi:hypothetical protein
MMYTILQLRLWFVERFRIHRRPFTYDFPLDLPAGRFGDFVDELQHNVNQHENFAPSSIGKRKSMNIP